MRSAVRPRVASIFFLFSAAAVVLRGATHHLLNDASPMTSTRGVSKKGEGYSNVCLHTVPSFKIEYHRSDHARLNIGRAHYHSGICRSRQPARVGRVRDGHQMHVIDAYCALAFLLTISSQFKLLHQSAAYCFLPHTPYFSPI